MTDVEASRSVAALRASYTAAVHRRDAAVHRRDAAASLLADRVAARDYLVAVAGGMQQAAAGAVASVVTSALQAVFGESAYGFEIDLVERRGKTEVDLYLTRDGERYSPLDATGGGVCDVVSFALRLATLILSRPVRRRLLVLDEPFRHLSRDYSARVASLLDTLCADLQMQVIMTTHNEQLSCGLVHKLG